jgi:hypothetical protein
VPPEPAPARPAGLTRRRLLASAAALAAAPLPTPAAPPAPLSFHLVDGWILTSRDLEVLGIDAL